MPIPINNIQPSTKIQKIDLAINRDLISIENRTNAVVQAIPLENSIVDDLIKLIGKNKNWYTLQINGLEIYDKFRTCNQEEIDLIHSFSEPYDFVITTQNSLLVIKMIKANNQFKKIHLMKHPSLDAYVVVSKAQLRRSYP